MADSWTLFYDRVGGVSLDLVLQSRKFIHIFARGFIIEYICVCERKRERRKRYCTTILKIYYYIFMQLVVTR